MQNFKDRHETATLAGIAGLVRTTRAVSGILDVAVYEARANRWIGPDGLIQPNVIGETREKLQADWRQSDVSDVTEIVSADGQSLGFLSGAGLNDFAGAAGIAAACGNLMTAADSVRLLADTLDVLPDAVEVFDSNEKQLLTNEAFRLRSNAGGRADSYRRTRPVRDGYTVTLDTMIPAFEERDAALSRAHAVIARVERLAKIGYFVFDTENLQMTDLSPGIFSIATSLDPTQGGLSYGELLDRVHPDDRDRVAESTLRSIENGEHFEIEFRAITADGGIQYLWLTDATVPTTVGQKPLRVGIVQDVTDRVEREAALRENIAFRQAATETALDCVVTIDAEGVIREFNPAAEATFGFKAADVIGTQLGQTIIPPTMRDAHHTGLAHYLKTGEHQVLGRRIEVPAVCADGSELTVELAITPFEVNGDRFFTAYLRDITQRLAEQEALTASETKYQGLFHNSADAVFIHDKDGKIQDVNESAVAMLDRSRDELLSMSLPELHPKEDHPIARKALREVARNGKCRMNIGFLKADGMVVPAEVRARMFDGPDGPMIHGIARDVSEAHIRAEELRVAKEQAEAASEAKSRFLATISHEIRTPLNGVIGGLGLLADTNLAGDQAAHTAHARNAAEGLLSLINDLLDFAKIEAGHATLEVAGFDLWDCVHRVVDIIKPISQQKKLPVMVDIDPGVPRFVSADSSRLRQILLNLLSNAVKFTEQGSVRVLVSAEEGATDTILRFAIVDTGIGIPDDMRDRLFGDFVQLESDYRRRFGGTGLGLAISKRLTSLMGGAIGFESDAGRGSTFWFTLPVSVSEQQLVGSDKSASHEPGNLEGRILLAEDSQTNAYVALALLRQKGARVDHVSNGAEAIEAMKARAYDLVLMDVSMPEVDGIEATQTIKALPSCANVPIVAMTAHVGEEDRRRCFEAGMDDYVIKPLDKATFLTTVFNWLPSTSVGEVGDPAQASHAKQDLQFIDSDHLAVCWDGLDQATKQEIVQLFGDEMKERIAALQQNAGTPIELKRQAHSLKGAAANVGANSLADLAAEIEEAIAKERPFVQMTDKLSDISTRTLQELETHISMASVH
ncbi:PAS domain S-box protein [Pyruvatibacter sp.]